MIDPNNLQAIVLQSMYHQLVQYSIIYR